MYEKFKKNKKDTLIAFSIRARSLLKCTTDHQIFFVFHKLMRQADFTLYVLI